MRLDELKGFRNFPELDILIQSLVDNEGSSMAAILDLKYHLMRTNYRVLGNGLYGITFQPPTRNYVIKIYIRDSGYDAATRIMKKNQHDPHIPKIIWGPATVNHQRDIKAIVLEQLLPLKSEAIRDTIHYLRYGFDKIEYHDFKLDLVSAERKIFSNFKSDPASGEIGMQFFKDIWPTLHKFYSRDRSLYFDLHPGNFMQRADGTVVVTDPLV